MVFKLRVHAKPEQVNGKPDGRISNTLYTS